MAKERSAEKKEKKEKRRASEADGVTKHKKEKKSKSLTSDTSEMEIDSDGATAASDTTMEDEGDAASKAERPTVKLAPFAVPLAEDKLEKKVMKGVKRAAKNKAIRRGVKEVVKALRKSTTKGKQLGVVVMAADVSPWDVLTHIPVLCEDHDVKYMWVRSRAELGAAGSTKRPTSVVMICPKASAKAEQDPEWDEQYADLWKAFNKASKAIPI